jgi:hypothetical protein
MVQHILQAYNTVLLYMVHTIQSKSTAPSRTCRRTGQGLAGIVSRHAMLPDASHLNPSALGWQWPASHSASTGMHSPDNPYCLSSSAAHHSLGTTAVTPTRIFTVKPLRYWPTPLPAATTTTTNHSTHPAHPISATSLAGACDEHNTLDFRIQQGWLQCAPPTGQCLSPSPLYVTTAIHSWQSCALGAANFSSLCICTQLLLAPSLCISGSSSHHRGSRHCDRHTSSLSEPEREWTLGALRVVSA